MKSWLWAAMVACAFSAEGASPSIKKISPLGVAPGTKTKLTITGSNLESATNLWTSFDAKIIQGTSDGKKVSFEVACPASASGVGAIQVFGPEGVSEFELVLIDPLPVASAAKENQTMGSAQVLMPPVAVDWVFQTEKVDYYRFAAKAREDFSIEVLAHRIGSQGDPVVQVLDAAGQELDYADDEDGVWRDARFQFRAPTAGDYFLAVHDVGYAGGTDSPYRLRIGHFPIAWFSYPLRDWTEPGTREGAVASLAGSPANPEGGVWLSGSPMLVEREPNDTKEFAQEFSAPVVLNGRFQAATDRDLYRFTLPREQKLSFQRQSRSLGSPCDVVLRILKPDGSLIVETDGRSQDDALLNRTLPAGSYFLEARELTGTAAQDAPYRVKVQPSARGFRLATEINKLEVAPDGSGKLKVTCERQDYDGEIRLESSEVILENNVIPENKNEIELNVKRKESAANLVHFSIHGNGDESMQAKVSTRPALRKQFSLMLNPPPELDGLIALGVKP